MFAEDQSAGGELIMASIGDNFKIDYETIPEIQNAMAKDTQKTVRYSIREGDDWLKP